VNEHVHVAAIHTVITALEVLVVFGTLNWLAMKYKDSSSLAASFSNLFGLN
jgi:hypothetical protein